MNRLRATLPAVVALAVVAQDAAAQRRITGRVTASTGEPLSAVTVQVLGTTAGALTNEQGQFTVVVPQAGATLRFRRIGYQQREVALAAGQAEVNVALTRDVLQLEQVTITGNTTSLSTRNATTAVSVVNAQEVTRAPSQSIEQALQGKVLGAKIDMNSGAPGGGGQIQIRGVTSVLGNGQPLIVVDGVIFSNEGYSSGANSLTGAGAGIATSQDAVVNRLADLNPNEIESVEVLKSAAATALYGSRASNGVVVIRTKRGIAGATKVNLVQRVGTQGMLRKLGQRQFTSVEQIVDLPYGNGESAEDALKALFPSGTIPASANRDIESEFYDNKSPSYATILSLTGGNERTQFFSSLTNDHETGLAPRTGRDLQAGRFNVDQQFSQRFRASLGINVTRNDLNRGLSNNDNAAVSPIYNFAYSPWVIPYGQKDANGNYPENPFNGGGASTSNPFQTFEYVKVNEQVYRSTGSANVTYNAVETDKNRLALNVQGGFDRFQQEGDIRSPAFLQFEPNDNLLGTLAYSDIRQLNYNFNTNLTHTFTPGAIASFTTAVGTGYERQGGNVGRVRARGVQPGITNPFVTGAAQQLDVAADGFIFRDQFATVTEQILAFGEKLAINGGVRFDRSSSYGERSKWYAFPRVAGSYLLETPMVTQLDNIKVRASLGFTGNRPRFADRFLVLGSGTAIGGQTSLTRPATVNNPDIKPERLRETEFGADLQGFGGRAVLEATVYDRTITDLLFTAPAAPSSGFTNLVLNTGELTNKGLELGLQLLPIQTRTTTWTSRINFQTNRQEVNDLPASIPRFTVPGSFGVSWGRNSLASGYRTTYIWGNAPLNPTTLLPLEDGYFAKNPNAKSGTDYVVRDTVIGDANPDFLMNFNNSVQFGRFTVSALVDWRKGGMVANMTHTLYDEGGTSRDYDDPSPVAGMPKGEYNYAAWNGGNDARAYLEDGSNVRLREVQVAFDAPQSFARRVRANSLRVSLQGRNLLMATDYWGYDPEFNNFANTNLNRFIDLAPFPAVRQFSIQFDLGF
ncbi:SusC/RagA family TonB-linked outer membrane protein [Roseisolibacter agri]|uniref:SusC/RagA family TonB-linked outer membrane protein n=1 Tax=Roseisolibacter agri TaxID=2014610 RepID=A0AA37Q3S2_9BACT|nr:SusC/RagA family TonB-linked outer membrane protein [Roseisolibacter agri]GLC26030.1 SusC/RagA family TonB-linked outer membrane protein [Roseisolibacter agri]